MIFLKHSSERKKQKEIQDYKMCAGKFDLLLVSARVGDNGAFEMTSGKDMSLPMLIYVNMIFVESF